MQRLLSLCFYFFSFQTITAQTSLQGYVKDNLGEPITTVVVLLKEIKDTSIVKYTYSNEKGFYQFDEIIPNSYVLEFSRISYQTKNISIDLESYELKTIDVILESQNIELDEVIVKADNPILQKKDTIQFKVSAFKQGNEQVLKDILENLPGIEVDTDGIIKVGGRPIERILIEGDDLFERGYKLLSENLPVNPVDKIEIINRYSKNKLLKNIEDSDNIAINIRLKEDFKATWFGNAEAGYGIDSDNHIAKANLININKNLKNYFLGSANNIGVNPQIDIISLIQQNNPTNQFFPINENNIGLPLASAPAYSGNLSQERVNFNNVQLISNSSVFKLRDNLKINLFGYLNNDKKELFNESVYSFEIGEGFINTETRESNNKILDAAARAKIEYDISSTKSLEVISQYSRTDQNSVSNLSFNTDNFIENISTDQKIFDNKIYFTSKYDSLSAFQLIGTYKRGRLPQNYLTNGFYLEELFENSEEFDFVRQTSEIEKEYYSFLLQNFKRKTNGNLVDITLGYSGLNSQLLSSYELGRSNEALLQPNSFSNNFDYKINRIYATLKHLVNLGKVEITSELRANQFFNRINENQTYNGFVFDIKVDADLNLNERNAISLSLSRFNNLPETEDVLPGYAQIGFRSFARGLNNLNPLKSNILQLRHSYEDWNARFFVNTFFTYNLREDYFSTNSTTTSNFVLADKILFSDGSTFIAGNNIEYYISKFKNNMKIETNYQRSSYANIVNESPERIVTDDLYTVGFSFRSGFSGFFNYHLGSQWKINNTSSLGFENSISENLSFINFDFSLGKKLNLGLASERYQISNPFSDREIFNVFDLDLEYTILKNKFSVFLNGRNIGNTRRFIRTSVNDVGSSSSFYRTLPRIILLKGVFRF